MILSITNTPSPPGVSDRGVESPQGVPVASILVRYSVAPNSSRVGHDGWARVRYTSCGPSPLFRHLNIAGFLIRIGAGHSTLALSRWQRVVRYSRCTFFNLGGAYGPHSLFSSLRKFCQEPRGVLTVLSRPCLRWLLLLHVDEHEPERLKCRANALKDFTK
jgi:hypothetical protein